MTQRAEAEIGGVRAAVARAVQQLDAALGRAVDEALAVRIRERTEMLGTELVKLLNHLDALFPRLRRAAIWRPPEALLAAVSRMRFLSGA